jgi:hypothetical protein
MSYLIHNFNEISFNYLISSRIKFQLILKYLNLQRVIPSIHHSFRNWFIRISDIVFKKSKIYNFHYENNLTKSSIFIIHYNMYKHMSQSYANFVPIAHESELYLNQIWSHIKILNQNSLANKFDKLFFLFIIFIGSNWNYWNFNLNFNLNFIILNLHWKLFILYQGPFFKIYNI